MAKASNSDIYQFKITLKHIRPPIWRRVQVPKDYTFKDMSKVIITAMGWLNCHNHKFEAKGYDIGPRYDGDYDCGKKIIEESTVKLSEYFKAPKDRIIYEYDFGDSWEHTVVLEKVLPRNSVTEYPICVAGKRACPPEDCGGVDGYEDHLKIMADPNHEEYEETMEWLERIGLPHWKSETFDPKSIKF